MLRDLENLAVEVARVSKVQTELSGGDALLVGQAVTHLEHALEELLDRPGMLIGQMPWWTDRAKRDAADQPPQG